ncbi:MAG: TonB-dependent receptor [Candidatus Hydrogenedentota bacterium]|nr:MAG: TonB-dependent receptor [Candidatus Hydrogenedentota bacterium]
MYRDERSAGKEDRLPCRRRRAGLAPGSGRLPRNLIPFLFVMLFLLEPFAFAGAVRAGSIRLEGNVDLSAEIRRDADRELDDRQIGFERPFYDNRKRPAYNLEFFDPRVEIRAYATPAAPVEIFAKFFNSNDLFLGEAHTRLRYTKGRDKKERGIESYFFYRQGRLNLGDPVVTIAFDQFGNGIATAWWLGQGDFAPKKGRWSGELNLQNNTGELNSFGEDNEFITAKLRHDYEVNEDWNLAGELLYARKNFTDRNVERQFNEVYGSAFTVSWKNTNLALQYNFSQAQELGFSAPDNGVFGIDLRNLILLDRKKTGRWGLNATYVDFGRNYRNFIGRNASTISYAHRIANGVESTAGDVNDHEFFGELYWDVPKYDINLTLRQTDRYGRETGRRLERQQEVDLNLKLVRHFSLRSLYVRRLFGLEEILEDLDANRIIRTRSMRSDDYYLALTMVRKWGQVKLDYRRVRHRARVRTHYVGAEATYKANKKLTFLARGAMAFVRLPQTTWAITTTPYDFGTQRRISFVEPFSRRKTLFAQIQYRPNDNSQIFLEYGNGFHLDNDLSLDGDFQIPDRHTDHRIFMKAEMWF